MGFREGTDIAKIKECLKPPTYGKESSSFMSWKQKGKVTDHLRIGKGENADKWTRTLAV